MYRTTKKKLVKRVGISTVVALGALGVGATVAGAASSTGATSARAAAHDTTPSNPDPGQECIRGPAGVITALSSTSLSVTDPSGTATTFAISSTTTVTKDRRSATIADLALGEEVHVVPSATDSSTAARVDVVQPSVRGKVTAVNGDTISVVGPNSTSATVIVSGATTYTKDGASAMLGDVTVGSSIFAEGSFASSTDTSTLDATNVGIGQSGGPGPGFVGPAGPAMPGTANGG